MSRNMLIKLVGTVLCVRQNDKNTLEPEWDEFLGFLEARREQLEQIRVFIATDGGVPTMAQRHRIASVLGNTHMLVAAVSDSVKVRFAGATISLFQRHYCQYSTKEIRRAYGHLKMSPREIKEAKEVIEELTTALYSRPPETGPRSDAS